MTSPPSLLLCDLCDVLVRGIEGIEVPLAEALGTSSAKVAADLFSADFTDLWFGKTSEMDFLEGIIDGCGWSISAARLRDMLRTHFTEVAEVRSVYERAVAEVPAVLVSVNCPEWAEYMESTYHFTHLFERVIYSFEVHTLKRDEAFYGLAEVNLGHPPSELLLIDDSRRNLGAASRAGVAGIHFTDHESLTDELKRKGVLV